MLAYLTLVGFVGTSGEFLALVPPTAKVAQWQVG